MPTIRKGETKDEWMPRCIEYLINNEGYDTEQATAICDSMWEENDLSKDLMDIKLELYKIIKDYNNG